MSWAIRRVHQTRAGRSQRYPAIHDATVAVWRVSNNFWLRRTTLLFQLSYKANTDADLLFSLIKGNLDADEFFIQKAIGWALREYLVLSEFKGLIPPAGAALVVALDWAGTRPASFFDFGKP